MATDMTVANTILQQLGGRRFIAMTGAKDFVGSENSLSMRLPTIARCNGRVVNKMTIELAPSDTYIVRVAAIRKLDYKVVEERTDVYVENLQQVFTALTGLDTHL